MEKKRIVVVHMTPDLEALFGMYLMKKVPSIANALRIDTSAPTKFIPSGPLRQEDFPDAEVLDGLAIEAEGEYVFFDCGGGKYDQHGRPENRDENTVTSIDLLAQDVQDIPDDSAFPWLLPLIEIISRNDRTGEKVANDPGRKGSSTPHTARTVRSFITGLNVLFDKDPELVEEFAHRVFDVMVHRAKLLIDKTVERKGAFQTLEGVEEAKKKGADFGQLFHLGLIIDSCKEKVGMLLGLPLEKYREMTIKELRDLGETFSPEVDAKVDTYVELAEVVVKALEYQEKDWAQAESDYWSDARVMTGVIKLVNDGRDVHKSITIVVGHSETARFGEVARLGNTGKGRPYPKRNRREKADVVIQLRESGKFTISTRGGYTLENAAAVLREADLYQKRVRLTKPQRATLERPGNLSFVNLDGKEVQTLYFAEYRTACGNAFRSNPFMSPTALNGKEIVHFTLEALAGSSFTEIREQLRGDEDGPRQPRQGGRYRREGVPFADGEEGGLRASLGDLVKAHKA